MKRRSLQIFFLFLILLELALFRDYILPIQWGQIKVSGLVCTCPDESVLNGRLYLRFITPDSLKKYDLDYSEIYVSERPFTDFDPMGADLYMIKGKVIGKQRVSKGDPWNPLVQVESWHEVDIITNWLVKGLFYFQLLIMYILLKWHKNRSAGREHL